MTIFTNPAGPFQMLESYWEIRKKELKEKFSMLTDSDLSFEPGKENELLDRIKNRLNQNCEKGHHYIVYHCG